MKTKQYIHREKNKGWSWKTHQRGSIQHVPVVPLRETSHHSPAGLPPKLIQLAVVMLWMLATNVVAWWQGTPGTAISAAITYPGLWLARFQHWWRNYLKTSWQLPTWIAVPTPVASLPCGVQKRQDKIRRFALFRHGAVHHRS